jgi:hypothetical protein
MTIATRHSPPSEPKAKPRLPPRWFVRLFWLTHRRLYRMTGGRVGLWRPKSNRWGAMRLTTVDLADGPRLVIGRVACGEERERLWSRWREIDNNLDAYAARRFTETAVVVLEPPATTGGDVRPW